MTITKKQKIWGGVILGLGLLIWGGFALYNWGQRSQLEKDLEIVNGRLQTTSARILPEVHLELLAKRDKLQRMLNNL